MQAKHPSRRTGRIISRERDLLDQKWLTHLLTCILVLLGGIFVLAATRREWIIDQAKWIAKFAKLGLGLE
jgi:hypothetical protein